MTQTLAEIQNQPISWRQTLDLVKGVWPKLEDNFLVPPQTHVLFIGCGTSYYLAQTAARLFQQVTGYISQAVPASEVFLAPSAVIPMGVPVMAFAISRSGTTTEVVYAVEYLRHHAPHIPVIGLTCNASSELAQHASYVITLDHAAENSVVMTQSFTNMLLALQSIAARLAGRRDLLGELEKLPRLLEERSEELQLFARRLGEDTAFNQFIYLGLGPYYGLASEATLKLKEMTQVRCEAYNPLEFRHGPISMVETGTVVVALAGHTDFRHIQAVLDDVRAFGGVSAVLAPDSQISQATMDEVCALPDEVSDWSRTPLYMPVLQHLALVRALRLGLNPDEPRHLSQVVVLNLGWGGDETCL